MKMMRGFLVVAAMVPMMMLVACGKKDEGGTIAVTPTQYYTANNQCYQSGTTTVVSSTYCTNVSGTGYYQSGNVCFQNGTNTVVNMTLCQNQGVVGGGSYPVGQVPGGYIPGVGGNIGGTIGMGGGQYCMGYFYSPYNGWGVCNGTNCHNVMLYNQYGQPVYCP